VDVWQNDLLQKVGFKRRTYLPSTFEKKAINQDKDPSDVATYLCSGAALHAQDICTADVYTV
jgi:hypothetical protein